jgi:hypothetical protein
MAEASTGQSQVETWRTEVNTAYEASVRAYNQRQALASEAISQLTMTTVETSEAV